MLERLLIAAALGALVLIAIQLVRWWYTRRMDRIEHRLREHEAQPGQPRIVYFTTQTCVICKVQQEPALSSLLTERSDILIERHDAVANRTLADEYGVLSVPTTAVYNASGRLVTINRGFAPAARLLAQVNGTETTTAQSGPAESLR